MKSKYKYGDHKALCDVCGRAWNGSDLRLQWDNLLACPRCWDAKHPDLEPIIAPKEDPMVPDARPRPSFDNLTFVDIDGLSEWGGMMNSGNDYGTEFTWDEMDISWDENESPTEITLR